MSVQSERFVTKPCEGCGELVTIDTTEVDVAIHDCDEGEWLLIQFTGDPPFHPEAS